MRYCSKCKKEKEENYCKSCKKNTSNNFVMKTLTETIKVRIILLKLIHKRPGIKKFLRKVYTGFQFSGNTTKHPEGVDINRVVDREHNKYEETITDYKNKEVVRNISEPLDQHISSMEKRNR